MVLLVSKGAIPIGLNNKLFGHNSISSALGRGKNID